MQTLKDFYGEWEANYAQAARHIPLFDRQPREWTGLQKILFANLFYHSRGHFYRFLWVMASQAPSFEFRSVVIRNITDELGGLKPDDFSHEQLFFHFAKKLNPMIYYEAMRERWYLPFLRDFNESHFLHLMNAGWDAKWSMFAAYELLDNVDYENLEELAREFGLSGNDLLFFEVHRNSDHFGETFQLLEGIWDKKPIVVCKAFDYIASTQLTMWRRLSDRVFQPY